MLTSSLHVTPRFLPMNLTLFLITSMENSCLLIPLVGSCLSAANDCIKLAGYTDLASLQFYPGSYLSGRFVFDTASGLSSVSWETVLCGWCWGFNSPMACGIIVGSIPTREWYSQYCGYKSCIMGIGSPFVQSVPYGCCVVEVHIYMYPVPCDVYHCKVLPNPMGYRVVE